MRSRVIRLEINIRTWDGNIVSECFRILRKLQKYRTESIQSLDILVRCPNSRYEFVIKVGRVFILLVGRFKGFLKATAHPATQFYKACP